MLMSLLVPHAVLQHNAARQSRNQIRFVGAGLVPALHKGTHEGCPYNRTRE
jgi:hypothetical protein